MKLAKLNPGDHCRNDYGEGKGMGKTAVTEPVLVRDVEVKGDHIEVWKYRKHCQCKGQTPSRHRGRAELPKGGPHEGMRDYGGHLLRDRPMRRSTPRCLTDMRFSCAQER